jgi:hypothetical protein
MIGFPGSDLSKVIIPHLNFKAEELPEEEEERRRSEGLC